MSDIGDKADVGRAGGDFRLWPEAAVRTARSGLILPIQRTTI